MGCNASAPVKVVSPPVRHVHKSRSSFTTNKTTAIKHCSSVRKLLKGRDIPVATSLSPEDQVDLMDSEECEKWSVSSLLEQDEHIVGDNAVAVQPCMESHQKHIQLVEQFLKEMVCLHDEFTGHIVELRSIMDARAGAQSYFTELATSIVPGIVAVEHYQTSECDSAASFIHWSARAPPACPELRNAVGHTPTSVDLE